MVVALNLFGLQIFTDHQLGVIIYKGEEIAQHLTRRCSQPLAGVRLHFRWLTHGNSGKARSRQRWVILFSLGLYPRRDERFVDVLSYSCRLCRNNTATATSVFAGWYSYLWPRTEALKIRNSRCHS